MNKRLPLTPIILILLTCIIEIVIILSRTRETWIGVWPQATIVAQLPLSITAPIWASYLAQITSRNRLIAFTHASNSHRPTIIHLTRLLKVMVMSIIPLLSGLLYVSFSNMPTHGDGFIWWSYVCLALCEILGTLSIALLIGTLASGWFAPVVTLFISYLWLVVSWDFSGSTISLVSGYPSTTINPIKLITLTFLVFAMCGIALTVATLLPLRQKAWITKTKFNVGISFSLICLVVASIAFSLSGTMQQRRPAPSQSACTNTTITICVWPENRHRLPELTNLAENIANLTTYGFQVPSNMTERGLKPQATNSIPFSIKGGSTWFFTEDWADKILDQSTKICAKIPDKKFDQYFIAYNSLRMWLTYHIQDGKKSPLQGGPPGIDAEKIRKISLSPQKEQHQWVKTQLQVLHDVSGC